MSGYPRMKQAIVDAVVKNGYADTIKCEEDKVILETQTGWSMTFYLAIRKYRNHITGEKGKFTKEKIPSIIQNNL